VGTNQGIMWDTSKLTGPCDIHLVPAGATDLTVVITDIVLGTANTGSYQWTPEKTLTTTHVAIILVDATKTFVKSDDFIIIILEDVRLIFYQSIRGLTNRASGNSYDYDQEDQLDGQDNSQDDSLDYDHNQGIDNFCFGQGIY